MFGDTVYRKRRIHYKPNIEEVTRHYEAFWNRDKLDRIPIGIRFPTGSLQAHESYLEGEQEKQGDQEEKWEDIVLDFRDYFNHWDKQLRTRRELLDDSIPTAPTDLGPGLMCRIAVANNEKDTRETLFDFEKIQC